MYIYIRFQTKLHSAAGERGSFNVDAGYLYTDRSALNPYVFLILMDALSTGVRKEVPESGMFADNIVPCKEFAMTECLDA